LNVVLDVHTPLWQFGHSTLTQTSYFTAVSVNVLNVIKEED